MNKNLALFLALVAGICVFALVVWTNVPRRNTAMENLPVPAGTDYAVITEAGEGSGADRTA